VTEAVGERFFDDERGVTARELMLNEIRSQLGHELFTANSFLDLLALVEGGAGNMVKENELTDDHLLRARSSTQELLDSLSNIRDASEAEPAFSGRTLAFFQETTVEATRRRWCPGFWPFC
jgi:hypothetical protein